ncbi:MAG: hypothetical protein U0234_13085 [Sandaracinus sp.]
MHRAPLPSSSSSALALALFVGLALGACATSTIAPGSDAAVLDGSAPSRERRVPDRAVVALVGRDATSTWWLEERVAGQPIYLGEHELGPRSLVRLERDRIVVWAPAEDERLVDATLHASGDWSAVGVDASNHVFLARGDVRGLRARITLDDPAIATDPWAAIGGFAPELRVASLTESGISVAADGEDVVVAIPTRESALLAYRWSWTGAAFARGPRTLVSPSIAVSPIMGIGGSYDDFDSYVGPYLLHLGIDAATGRAFVATYTDQRRVDRHDAANGTHHSLLRDVLYPRENTSDVLVVGIDRDGSIAFSTIVGTVDVEDELQGLAVGPTRVAVFGRSRRELGRDNTELHAMVAELTHEGVPLGTSTLDLESSALVEAAAYDGDTLYVGGSAGWEQNPNGRSLFTAGHAYLARLDGAAPRTVTRLDALLPATAPASELRALTVQGGMLFTGGHERGPLTHTGDGDRSRIRSDAWWIERPLSR